MTWNYRVMKYADGEGVTHFAVHEVYYDAAGNPEMYTENPCAPYGETLEELAEDLKAFSVAFTRPVLSEGDFPSAKRK